MDRDAGDEIKRHFDVVVDGVRDDVRALAEGVDLLSERVSSLETRFESFQHDVRREFSETQAMIRLSTLS